MQRLFNIRNIYFPLLLSFPIFSGCFQSTSSTENNSYKLEAYRNFRQKEKFIEEHGHFFHPVLFDSSNVEQFSTIINSMIDDFSAITVRSGSNEEYLKVIDSGIMRFQLYDADIDSMDKEILIRYMEELTEIAGLTNSGGRMIKWRQINIPQSE